MKKAISQATRVGARGVIVWAESLVDFSIKRRFQMEDGQVLNTMNAATKRKPDS